MIIVSHWRKEAKSSSQTQIILSNAFATGNMPVPLMHTYLFRCDANRENGLGHLARSLSLAEALRATGRRSVFVGCMSSVALELIHGAGFTLHPLETVAGTREDAHAFCQAAALHGSQQLFADDYRIGLEWHRCLNNEGYRACIFDDFARLPDYSVCAGAINFTVEAATLHYPGLSSSRLAIGPTFFAAREALVKVREIRSRADGRDLTNISRILVTIGGTDHHGLTRLVLDALREIASEQGRRPEIRAIAGPDLLADKELQKHFSSVLLPIAPSLAEHYTWADICISGGGLIKYECAYLGIPVAILSQTDEQQLETEQFTALGLGADMGYLPDHATLCQNISALLTHPGRLHTLQEKGARVFPSDSHLNCAKFLIHCLESSP